MVEIIYYNTLSIVMKSTGEDMIQTEHGAEVEGLVNWRGC
jgi:hypothetical protein